MNKTDKMVFILLFTLLMVTSGLIAQEVPRERINLMIPQAGESAGDVGVKATSEGFGGTETTIQLVNSKTHLLGKR